MNVSRAQVLDFLVLTLRWYLAFYMADYGWGKMTGGQFGVHDPAILERPLKDVDKFYLAWHLFGLDKSFDIGVGLMQILGAVLIVINRTALAGALFLLPVLVQIFLVDVAFTMHIFGPALPVRLAGMIVCDLLILSYYKERMIRVWHTLTDGLTTRFRYRWWVYLLLPVLGMATDFALAILTIPVKALAAWLGR